MENHITLEISEQGSPKVPSLIKYISSKEVDGFDTLDSQFPSPTTKEPQAASPASQQDEPLIINHERKPSVSISMPLTTEEIQIQPLHNNKKVFFSGETVIKDSVPISSSQSRAAGSKPAQPPKCHSQPMPKGCVYQGGANSAQKTNHPGIEMFRDKRFDSFKTWSGTLERQLSILRKAPAGSAQDGNNSRRSIDRRAC